MSSQTNSVQFLARGRWQERHVTVTRTASTRRIVPGVEAAIDRAWEEVNARPGVTLFDGPVCRLESFSATPDRLELAVSQTSYRINVGTNFCHPEFAERFGRDVMANPVGVSAGVVSSDGFLLMGRRNGSVAYYPHKLHPFAGSVEVRDSINLFDDVRRELHEELHLGKGEITHIECIGIVEDQKLLHPETIFLVRASLSAEHLQRKVLLDEHGSSEAVDAYPTSLRAFAQQDDVTPVGSAVAIRLAEILDESAT
jgi:8-oxo-dGTP pyrophosphatase MutT (NUDIX family)